MVYGWQKERMKREGMSPIPFKIVLSQVIDLVGDVSKGISMTRIRGVREKFFRRFVDFKEFDRLECDDPVFQAGNGRGKYTMWDAFCEAEYERLTKQ
jgi:hypothetical protein